MKISLSRTASMLTIAGATLVVAAAPAAAVPDQPDAWEKCAGIARAGLNDCGSLDGSHPCAGQGTKDADPNEWVYLPKGACAKIGGEVKGEKPAK